MKPSLCLVALFAVLSCKTTTARSPTSSVKADNGQLMFSETISSEAEFKSLAHANPRGLIYIKFTHLYGVPSTDKDSDKLFFQNTQVYEVHQAFLKKHVERYRSTADEDFGGLIMPPLNPADGSPKEITAGTLRYKPATATEAAFIGYDINFNLDPSDSQKTAIDMAEVARFDKKLKAALTFVPAANIVYLLSKPNDPKAFKFPLKKLGVNTAIEASFAPMAKVATTYSAETSYGYLRSITHADVSAGNYTDRDILIFQSVPLDIGPVAGIISEEPQVAHSHVIFRAVNQKIPDIYIPGAASEFAGSLGKLVKLSTLADDTYTIQTEAQNPSLLAEAEAYWKARRPTIVVPDANVSVTELRVWTKNKVDKAQVQAYGAKATNFAILDEALRVENVDRSLYDASFMVPFSYFNMFMKSPVTAKACTSAQKKCDKDLKDEALGGSCSVAFALCSKVATASGKLSDFTAGMIEKGNREKMYTDASLRKPYLFFINRLMRETELSSEILAPIQAALKAYPESRRMRLRSSTNAEDLAGLNGAGLYESKAACLGDGENSDDKDGKTSVCRTSLEVTRMQAQVKELRALKDEDGSIKKIADEVESDINKKYPLKHTIRSVYASLWTERAFLNREYYGMDHSKIYMGMLVHPAFVNESVNGVAVLNFNADESIEVKIVSQVQDVSITNPIIPGALPEELSVVRDASGSIKLLKVISNSTLVPASGRVLGDDRMQDVTRQLIIAGSALRAAHGGNRYDLEFMLDENSKVLIKQGRPL